jgi:hypothetical protein
MASKMTHFKGISVVDGDIRIKLKFSRFDKQFQRAQYQLDGNVMNSMVPFMPMISGDFVDVTRAASAAIQGTGQVYAAYGPAGRFLYQGKVMVSPVTGSTWAKKGEKKVLVSQYSGKTKAKEDLQYTKTAHPKAQAKWFDAAKKADGKEWIKQVKKTAGGGKRG